MTANTLSAFHDVPVPESGPELPQDSRPEEGVPQPALADLGAEGLKGFHLGYLAAAARLRRQMPMTWRSVVLNALAYDPLDRDDAGIESDEVLRYAPHLRGTGLAVARCESAATMLSWRKTLPPRHRDTLREALRRLIEQATRLGAI